MKRFLLGSVLIASAVSVSAWAQDDVNPSITAEQETVMRGVYDRTVRVTPRLGLIAYRDTNFDYTSRALGGFTADANLASLVTMPQRWNLGVETGLFYSHPGSSGSNFVGTNSTFAATPTAGANLLLVPIYAKVGYKPTDRTMVALNLGSNMIYRSQGSSMYLGRSGDTSSGSSVDFFPSVGLEGGLELSRDVGVSLRGDWIMTSGTHVLTGTLGATIGVA